MKHHHLAWLFMLLLLGLATSCTTDDSEEPAYHDYNYTPDGAAYAGPWTLGTADAPNGGTTVDGYAALQPAEQQLQLGLPHGAVARLAVETAYQDDAEANAYTLGNHFSYTEVGYSETSIYYQINTNRYVFHTRYGGAVHKITALLSGSTALVAKDFSQLNVVLRIDSLQVDDRTTLRCQPQLQLLFVSSKRIQ